MIAAPRAISIQEVFQRPEDCVVCMVTGYFDESGIHDSAIVTTIGGFISTAEGWDKFNRDWLAVLNEFDISCFHMKHFAHFLGEFAKLKDNEGRRRELLSKL